MFAGLAGIARVARLARLAGVAGRRIGTTKSNTFDAQERSADYSSIIIHPSSSIKHHSSIIGGVGAAGPGRTCGRPPELRGRACPPWP